VTLTGTCEGQADRTGIEFFENRIRPHLVQHCYDCHSAQAKKLKGGLRLDTRDSLMQGGDSGPVLIPGDPERSLLIRAVRQSEANLAMPPAQDGRSRLPEQVIADLTTWVKLGAPYPETPLDSTARSGPDPKAHWSFQPVGKPPVPPVNTSTWLRTSVDPFILARLEAQSASPAPPADRRTLIRRATFDLTGLPPSPQEIDTFLADPLPDAFARVVDRLLDSPHYGERWGRHWLDVVRYADTAGETADYPVPDAWRYRNYVINAFNTDKPYDEFLREQIAGDILARTGPREHYAERVTATGFLAVSRRFGFDSENYHHLTIQDTIDTLGQTVLGLSLGCARCHNHKFDPIPATDYYALYGIFESTRYAFPGSEQKQKRRALVPLVPPEVAQAKWHDFDLQVAILADQLRQQNQSVPSVVLRSLDDLDGDFEMQAPAAGGSKGVLVPPWVYDGPIAVTTEAQSPFKNVYPQGAVGAQISGGTIHYRLGQALPRGQGHDGGRTMFVNLDFNLSTNSTATPGQHRFWIGSQEGSPALEVFLSVDTITLQTGQHRQTLRSVPPNQWQNLQLQVDRVAQTISGTLGAPGEVVSFSGIPLTAQGSDPLNEVGFDSPEAARVALPGLQLDNLSVQSTPFVPVATVPAFLANQKTNPAPAALADRLKLLAGHDGDFELQSDQKPPATPWGPGPNSAVLISAAAQSPFRNHYGPGQLGLQLPNSGAYNGFGQTLTNRWKAESTDTIFASFDFRCAHQEAGGEGSWRYYLGQGAGSSPAVELNLNGREFFRRSGDQRDSVRPLRLGEWYQVQLSLDLKAKHYTGVIANRTERTEFSGEFARGWDGRIDYTFIDSFGHLAGVKPALDADNMVIGETPLRPLEAAEISSTAPDERRQEVTALRAQMATLADEAGAARRQLERMLASGPVDLAYGAVEGTPRNTRLQLRGEPEKLGDEIPRGFLHVLGGSALPAEVRGSGRLELAQWLTRPDNPLTARVMVNRIWQYHFITGLVKTPNDFGMRGQPPTHPELLDHLAHRFIESGWSIKAMHRLILLSATYQQSSELTKGASPAHGAVTEYASFPRRRLSAEEIRDAILWVSGELDAAPNQGHPFPTPVGWGYSQHGPFSAVYDHNQRSVYLMTQRLKRHPFLALFDGADPNTSTAERRTTTVPTQSLFFLNDPFVHEKAEKLATRLQGVDSSEHEQVDLAYRLTLGRLPSDSERADVEEFLTAYRTELTLTDPSAPPTRALAALVRVLFGDNEFLHVD